jgi:hypothetical protein
MRRFIGQKKQAATGLNIPARRHATILYETAAPDVAASWAVLPCRAMK